MTGTFRYIASKPPGRLINVTKSTTFDETVMKLMDDTNKTWEWLKAHGYTVDRYETEEEWRAH